MIRFAREKDIPVIMEFINDYWKNNHIMSRDRVLFEFQHKWGNEISFILSESDERITGILGYIPYGRNDRDVTFAIWKTNKTEDTMQGIDMLSFLRKKGDIRSVSAPGINLKTIPIYKFLGFETGKMKQWYRLRKNFEYRIAKVTNHGIPVIAQNREIDVCEIRDFSEAELEFGIKDCLIRNHQLLKSVEYLKRRYFEHPNYSYIKYGLRLGKKKLFIVLRVQKCNGSALLRVIDCIGDHELIKYFSCEIDNLLVQYDCEYADCYETGVADEVFEKGGWCLVDGSGNIMPEYFAPFEQRNIDIYYMAENKGTILFKGDGDMDRPN